jgi:hypothetical protein
MVALFIQASEYLLIYLQVGQGVPQILQGHVLSSQKLILYACDAALFSMSFSIYH